MRDRTHHTHLLPYVHRTSHMLYTYSPHTPPTIRPQNIPHALYLFTTHTPPTIRPQNIPHALYLFTTHTSYHTSTEHPTCSILIHHIHLLPYVHRTSHMLYTYSPHTPPTIRLQNIPHALYLFTTHTPPTIRPQNIPHALYLFTTHTSYHTSTEHPTYSILIHHTHLLPYVHRTSHMLYTYSPHTPPTIRPQNIPNALYLFTTYTSYHTSTEHPTCSILIHHIHLLPYVHRTSHMLYTYSPHTPPTIRPQNIPHALYLFTTHTSYHTSTEHPTCSILIHHTHLLPYVHRTSHMLYTYSPHTPPTIRPQNIPHALYLFTTHTSYHTSTEHPTCSILIHHTHLLPYVHRTSHMLYTYSPHTPPTIRPQNIPHALYLFTTHTSYHTSTEHPTCSILIHHTHLLPYVHRTSHMLYTYSPHTPPTILHRTSHMLYTYSPHTPPTIRPQNIPHALYLFTTHTSYHTSTEHPTCSILIHHTHLLPYVHRTSHMLYTYSPHTPPTIRLQNIPHALYLFTTHTSYHTSTEHPTCSILIHHTHLLPYVHRTSHMLYTYSPHTPPTIRPQNIPHALYLFTTYTSYHTSTEHPTCSILIHHTHLLPYVHRTSHMLYTYSPHTSPTIRPQNIPHALYLFTTYTSYHTSTEHPTCSILIHHIHLLPYVHRTSHMLYTYSPHTPPTIRPQNIPHALYLFTTHTSYHMSTEHPTCSILIHHTHLLPYVHRTSHTSTEHPTCSILIHHTHLLPYVHRTSHMLYTYSPHTPPTIRPQNIPHALYLFTTHTSYHTSTEHPTCSILIHHTHLLPYVHRTSHMLYTYSPHTPPTIRPQNIPHALYLFTTHTSYHTSTEHPTCSILIHHTHLLPYVHRTSHMLYTYSPHTPPTIRPQNIPHALYLFTTHTSYHTSTEHPTCSILIHHIHLLPYVHRTSYMLYTYSPHTPPTIRPQNIPHTLYLFHLYCNISSP